MLRRGSNTSPASAPSTPAPLTPASSPFPPHELRSHVTEGEGPKDPRLYYQRFQTEGSPMRPKASPTHARSSSSACTTPRQNPPEAHVYAGSAAFAAHSPPPLVNESRHKPVQEYHNAFVPDGASVPGVPSFSPTTTHRRQQSVPNLLPFALINRATSPERRQQHRPRSPAPPALEMPLTGDGRRSTGRSSDSSSARGVLSGWFSGGAGGPSASSSPSSIHKGDETIPSPLSTATTPDTTPTRRIPQNGLQPTGSPSSSRFGFLASGMSALSSVLSQSPASSTAQRPSAPAPDDELINLNVETALFPGGPPSERDTFSPAAFKNLHMTAAALTRRLQSAYREQATAAREIAAERDAQRDELEEAETRAAHLKMQLEGMAHKAADQERAMRELVDELANERRKTAGLLASARDDDWQKQQQDEHSSHQQPQHPLVPVVISEGSVSEDLGVDAEEQRRRRRRRQDWRGSGDTSKSELSFDTDDESAESESVFSRSRSPTIAQGVFDGPGGVMDRPASSSVSSSLATGPPHRNVAALKPSAPAGPPQQPMTAFQKLVKNVTGATRGDDEALSGGAGCQNCRGQDASVAWNTVSLLRDENRGLKQRVGELESAVDGALDLVNGVGR